MKSPERYEKFKKLLKISEENPELLMPYWDKIIKSLDSKNNFHKYYGVLLISRLAKAEEAKPKKIIDKVLNLLEDKSFIVAMNTAINLGKMAGPELRNKITDALLNLDKTKHKHKDLLKSGAITSFMEYYDYCTDNYKKKIIIFVKSVENSKDSPKAKKLAKDFLKKYEKKK